MSLATGRTFALLLSRQPLYPCGSTPWVRAVVDALGLVEQRNGRVLTSVGMNTWELVLAATAVRGIPLAIALPADSHESFEQACAETACRFDLADSTAEFIRVPTEACPHSGLSPRAARDRYIVRHADILLPLSVRPGGSMERLTDEAAQRGVPVEHGFSVRHTVRQRPAGYRIEAGLLTDGAREIADGDFVVHWTRSSAGPWPGEKKSTYYRAILQSSSYPRDGIATLRAILDTGRIAASARHMPGRIPTVSFSDHSPARMLPLMRWRARYREMSYEPYGIGLTAQRARELGIRPVTYGSHSASVPRWLHQSPGVKGDWRAERELRHRGDLSLHSLAPRDIHCFCPTSHEARLMRNRFGVQALPLLKSPPA